jgi:hypothetical protein
LRYIFVLGLLGSLYCWSQSTATTPRANTTSPCSVANTGSDNKINIVCGIGKEQGKEILAVLNKVLANHLDTKTVMGKLDELIQSNTSSGVLLSPSSSAIPIIAIGDSNMKFGWIGKNGVPLFEFLQDSSLTVERIGDHIGVSTSIRDASGRMIAEIERNEWKVKPSLLWDRNYNATSLEVKDETGEVDLQVVVLPEEIRLQGIWHDKSGGTFELVKDETGQGTILVNRIIPITPIFVYPSERHLGEMRKP